MGCCRFESHVAVGGGLSEKLTCEQRLEEEGQATAEASGEGHSRQSDSLKTSTEAGWLGHSEGATGRGDQRGEQG